VAIEEACGGGCTSYIDAVTVSNYAQPTDGGCLADSGTPAACGAGGAATAEQLSISGDIELQATIRSPVDGAVNVSGLERYVFGTAASGANTFSAYWSNDTFTCSWIDSGGVARTGTVAAAGNADTAYRVVCQHAAAGLVRACWEGTCGNWSAAAAVLTAAPGVVYIGGPSATAGGNVWVTDFQAFDSLVTP
jgi:hypothetical protein